MSLTESNHAFLAGAPANTWSLSKDTTLEISVYIYEFSLIRLTLGGTLRDIDALNCAARLRTLPEFHAGFRVLYDTSDVVSSQITAGCIRVLVDYAKRDANKLAVIAPNRTVFGMARMYEITGKWSGSRVGVFSDERSALEWLGIRNNQSAMRR